MFILNIFFMFTNFILKKYIQLYFCGFKGNPQDYTTLNSWDCKMSREQ